MSTNQSAEEGKNVDRIGEISRRIRKAIYEALPTPPEQFLTIMVPGKVVNFDDYAIDTARSGILPLRAQLNQAILCDDMPTLSTIQMGPTGRSVSRSYGAAISKLVPSGTTIGIDDDKKSKTEEQQRYKRGMTILSGRLLDHPKSPTLVQLYTEMQLKYTLAVKNKDKAFSEALERVRADPRYRTDSDIRQAYDKWVEENARMYRNYVQAAYMEWVITGRKEEVEYWFSVVDQDSAMARVERSKEAMRWAVVQDSDGAVEYQKVKLEPSDWANKCFNKIKRGNQGVKTVEWYNWEISRLEQANIMLTSVKDHPPKLSVEDKDAIAKKKEAAEAALKGAMVEVLTTRKAYTDTLTDKKTEAKPKDGNSTGTNPDVNPAGNDSTGKKPEGKPGDDNAKQAALDAYNEAQTNLKKAQNEYNKLKLEEYSNGLKEQNNTLYEGFTGKDGKQGTIDKLVEKNNKVIEGYVAERQRLLNASKSNDESDTQDVAHSLGVPKAQSENETDTSKSAPAATQEAEFFTPITVKVSSTSDTKHTEASATGFEIGGAASWGLNSVSAAVSHNEGHTNASNELISSEVSVSFECMRVDITRPWLRPELFYDPDLTVPPGEKISPGPTRLKNLIEKPTGDTQNELASYNMFPMYPVGFLVACNVVLEISGSTTSLQAYMNDSSTSASLSVGYGPFSVSGGFSHSSSDATSTCKSTADGCRIEIKSPQIIGWISQMVPALPRLS